MAKNDLSVEWVSVDEVEPYDNNPRENDASVDKVVTSIGEFGWKQPIVVDSDMVVVVGHTRLKAAKRMGMDKVPVHVATDLTPEQVKAYRIMDNRAHDLSQWDYTRLRVELEGLDDLDFDLEATGFALEDLDFSWDPGADPDNEWQSMPEFKQEPLDYYKALTVRFMTEADYSDFQEVIGQKLTPKTKATWFPEQDLDSENRDKEYGDGEQPD